MVEGCNTRKQFYMLRGGMYTLTRKTLIKVGYSMEVPGYDGNNVLWEVVDYHVVE